MIRPEEWLPTDGLELEPNAESAVRNTDRNVVVAAGPGAGKTELLAQRADYLLRTGASRYPRRILAISFKVDAARNLHNRVRLRSGPQYAARFDSFTFHAFAKRLIDNYRPSLTGSNALKPEYRVHPEERVLGEQIRFDDFVPLALEILAKSSFARGALRQTYSHVFLDEFQDATSRQYSLIKAAFSNTGAQITAVGDSNQRIMVWAGALDGVMEKFAADFNAASLTLYQNFRSKPRLRRMQNRMILDMDPSAASPPERLKGEEGTVRISSYQTDVEEAQGVTERIQRWLAGGTPPREIAVLVRNQPHLVTAVLGEELARHSIPYRNEQESQDLTAEPAAALLLNYLRVVADDRRPEAYAELIRLAVRSNESEAEGLLFEGQLRQHLRTARGIVRAPDFVRADFASWKPLIADFVASIPKSLLTALSPSYQQGNRLREVLTDGLRAFRRELAVDGDPVAALNRLSEDNAVRFLTIHKCKGLEFEKVIVLGVEKDLFFGPLANVKSEFFVAISRAKDELVLTHSAFRTKPPGANSYWLEHRTAYQELLRYVAEPI